MNLKTEINLSDFFNQEELKSLAQEVARETIRNSLEFRQDVERIVTNAAYAVVGEKVSAALGKDMNDAITEKASELATNEKSLEFALFRDDRTYGGNYLGAVLKIAEDYVRQSCISRIHSAVDKVLDTIKFDTKKFEKLVATECAKIVAERMENNSKFNN